MIPLALDELRGLGRLEGGAELVTGVEIDSRRVGPGDLFVALGGGVAYLDEARTRGAARRTAGRSEAIGRSHPVSSSC